MSGLVLALALLTVLGWLYFRARAGKSPVPAGEIVFRDSEQIAMLKPLILKVEAGFETPAIAFSTLFDEHWRLPK